jgi:3-oxoacyl-[acyl-carrier protein] reductase
MDANSQQPPFDITGQSAVVTGSSSGIGRAIAVELARAGANVLVHARRSADAAERVADEIREMGRDATVVLYDLVEPENQTMLVHKAWKWKPIDIWVNNAGADVLTGTEAEWSFDQKFTELWSVDVTATVRLGRDVGRRMKKRSGGVILNMGWDQAESGMEGDSGELFATIKGAVMAFTRSLAKSLAPEVRVNCLAPGWIHTDWASAASDYWKQRAEHESLLGRWGLPEDVAHMACFLASPAASFINGQIMPINGGFARALDPPNNDP